MSLLLAGCAFGDGRGFATIDGTLTVEFSQDEFTTPGGAEGELDSLDISFLELQLEGDTAVEGGTEHRNSVLPIPGTFDPVDRTSSAAFGPYEVDRGDYSQFNAVINRLVVGGKVGDETFRLEIAPEGGIAIKAQADLPVNRERAPAITITARLILPDNLMEAVDPLGDENAAAAQIVANIMADGILDATWVRKAD